MLHYNKTFFYKFVFNCTCKKNKINIFNNKLQLVIILKYFHGCNVLRLVIINQVLLS